MNSRTVRGCLVAVSIALILGLGPRACAELASQEHAAADDAEHEHIGQAGGVSPDPAEFKIDLAIYTFVVFLLLLLILAKTAWRPIVAALDAREKHIHNEIAEAEAANTEAKRILAEHEKRMAVVQNEVRAIIDEARRDAQHTQQEILKLAQTEAQATRDRAVREIEQAKDHALQQLFHTAADVATEMAGQIVRRTLNPQDHRDLVAQVIKELPSQN